MLYFPTGGALVMPAMPVLQAFHKALGLARTQESYDLTAKVMKLWRDNPLFGAPGRPGEDGDKKSRWT